MKNKPKFSIGQKVIYTNEQGVCWGEKTIIAIEYWEGYKEPRYFVAESGNPKHYSTRESCFSAVKLAKAAQA